MVEFVSVVTDYSTVVISLLIGITVLVIVYISNLFKSQKEPDTKNPVQSSPVREPANVSNVSKQKKKGQNEKTSKQAFTHSWMSTSLKGHTGEICDMDFSPNGKFLVTCAEDRALFIWTTKDLTNKEHKNVRHNVEFDHASHVCWSPDSKAVIINKASENVLEVYRVAKKPDGSIASLTKAITFPKEVSDEVVGIGVAVNGRFIMSCSASNHMVVWDIKGSVLTTVDTCLLNTYCAKVSPCGRFVLASGFAPDVKVWEVQFTKSGEFKQVSRAFVLDGHTSGVYDFSINSDSSKIATVSKDGSWKIFNTKIEFEKGEDPRLLLTGRYSGSGPAHIALSPNGEVVAISTGASLSIFSTISGDCDKVIDNIYDTGSISRILFDSASEFILTSGVKHVRVFHNVTGRRVSIALAKEKLNASNNSAATKDRLKAIIKSSEEFLKSLNEPLVSKTK